MKSTRKGHFKHYIPVGFINMTTSTMVYSSSGIVDKMKLHNSETK